MKAQRRYLCVLEGVAHDALICEVHQRRNFATTTISIPRAEVRELRKVPIFKPIGIEAWGNNVVASGTLTDLLRRVKNRL